MPRLASQTTPGAAAPLARGKFADTDLATEVATGSHIGEKRGAKFLSLDAVVDWSQPLRGSGKNTLFVSFCVYGSAGTIIEIGGAKLGIVDSEIAHYSQLAAYDPSGAKNPWQALGDHAPLEAYDGRLLGSFSIMTVRLDPAAGTWDLYLGARLLAEDLPLDSSVKHAQFIVHAGASGAMVNGLVQSDENPIYEDANGNGIDDRFEQSNKGRLLDSRDSKTDRENVIKAWRTAQLSTPPPVLFFNRPRPDGK